MHILTLRKLLIGTFILAALGWVLVAMSMPLTDLVEREFIIAGPLAIYHAIPLHRAFGLIWLAVVFGSILWLDRNDDCSVYDWDLQLTLVLLAAVLIVGGVISLVALAIGTWFSIVAVTLFCWYMAVRLSSDLEFREGVTIMALVLAAAFGSCAGFYNGLLHGAVAGAAYPLFVWLHRSGAPVQPIRTA